MSQLGFLHDYSFGDIIDSSDWNDELNQILYAFGYEISNPNSFAITFSGLSDADNDPIYKLYALLTGDILQIGNGTLTSLIKNNGQIQLGANAVVPFIVASSILCNNLNADLLNSIDSTAFELDLFTAQGYFTFYTAAQLAANSPQAIWIAPFTGKITKLRIRQENVASADANTVITIRKNGTSIGTASIAGNVTVLQTNDIADVDIVFGDIITFEVTTYTGTTKHDNVSVGFNYKQLAVQ